MLPPALRWGLLAAGLALTSTLSACAGLGPGGRSGEAVGGVRDAMEERSEAGAGDEAGRSGYAVVPGSKAGAQRIVDAAERRFLAEPSAYFEVRWVVGAGWDEPMAGRFDASQPAAEVKVGVDEKDQYELRLRGDDTWLRATVDGRTTDCWMHVGGGAEDGGPTGVPYQALMLLEPKALGIYDDGTDDAGAVGHRVVVELPLAEAAPAALPRLGGLAATPIDPKATVRGIAEVGVSERYTSIEYTAADVFAALKRSRTGLPDVIRPLVDQRLLQEVVFRIVYHDYGTDVVVRRPPADRVADLGSWADLRSGRGAADGSAPSCEAALAGT